MLAQLRALPGEPFCPLGRRGRGARALPQQLCGLRPAALLPSCVLIGEGLGGSLDSRGLCLHTFCNIQFAEGLASPLQPPRKGRTQALRSLSSLQPAPRGPMPLLCPNTSVPLYPGRVWRGQEGRTWDGAAGWCARGCKGSGATGQGFRVQGVVGESAHKLPGSWCLCAWGGVL